MRSVRGFCAVCRVAAKPAASYNIITRASVHLDDEQKDVAAKAMELSEAQDKLRSLEIDLRELEVHFARVARCDDARDGKFDSPWLAAEYSWHDT